MDETPFSIVSEMLDLRNRELAAVTNVDDFIVNDHLISLMTSQLSENAELQGVFNDLFDAEGSENLKLRYNAAHANQPRICKARLRSLPGQSRRCARDERRAAFPPVFRAGFGVIFAFWLLSTIPAHPKRPGFLFPGLQNLPILRRRLSENFRDTDSSYTDPCTACKGR